MKSNLNNCKKIIYFEKAQRTIRNLLLFGIVNFILFASITHTPVYMYCFAVCVVGLIANCIWKKFFMI